MCIGVPMQVLAVEPGHAIARGRGQTRRVNTALVGEVAPGAWLLVFIDGARELISAERAAEVNATLDLIDSVMAGDLGHAGDDPGFTLPSSYSAAQMAALAGLKPADAPATPHPDTPA